MLKTAVLIATVCLLGSSAARAVDLDYVCTKQNGEKIRAVDCRLRATPVPTATPVPVPTIAMDCSDSASFGSLNYDPATGSLSLLKRAYEPGRVYHLCGTIPSNAPLKTFVGFSSVNHSNGACNLYSVWLTAPNGMTSSSLEVSQPGTNGSFARGTWGVAVVLDPKNNVCAANPGLSMTVRPF